MSIWTHVNASFRIDSIGEISDKYIYAIFGKPLTYEDLINHKYDKDEKYLPMGSEGTLKISIWKNPDENAIASTTVSVFGDLRNYIDIDSIEKWFYDCCDSFILKLARILRLQYIRRRGIAITFLYVLTFTKK